MLHMNRKTLWIGFWVTIVYWLGGALGCAKQAGELSDADLAEDPQVAVQVDGEAGPAAEQVAAAAEETPPAEKTATTTTDSSAPKSGEGDHAPAPSSPETSSAVAPGSNPPIAPPKAIGLDRSHWPTQIVGPASGITQHNPYYFSDVILDSQKLPSDLNTDMDTRLNSVLDGSQAGNWNDTNGMGVLIQPPKFALDGAAGLIIQPFKPFFATEETP
jgi:hypothetical protein